MLRIIRRIDQSNDDEIEVVRLEHASAAEVVRVLDRTDADAPRADGAPITTSLVADDARTNSVLVGGDKTERLRLRALIAHLDTPLEDGGDTQVRYLQYADAEELSTKLQQHFTQQASAAAGGGAAAPTAVGDVSVWADIQNNAIVVSAPPKLMRSLMGIVDKLDIRRAQVLVEAIIVEVIADNSADLGVTWAVDGSGSNSLVGLTDFGADSGPSVLGLGSAAAGDGANAAAGLGSLSGSGFVTGVGAHIGYGYKLRRNTPRTAGRCEYQHHFYADHRDDRQRGSQPQCRAGSTVSFRVILEYRQHAGGAVNPFPDYPAGTGWHEIDHYPADKRAAILYFSRFHRKFPVSPSIFCGRRRSNYQRADD